MLSARYRLGIALATLLATSAAARLKVVSKVVGLGVGDDRSVRTDFGSDGDAVLITELGDECSFGRVTMVSTQRPTPSPVVITDGSFSCGFARSVAGSREHLIVGDTGYGRALVYDHSGNLQRTLSPPEPIGADSAFGAQVAIGGQIAVVGSKVGVFVFDLTQPARTVQRNGFSAGFGSALAITQDAVVVADPQVQAIYAYDTTTFAPMWEFESPFDASDHAKVGQAIAADDESLIVAGAVDSRRGHGREVLLLVDPRSGREQRQLPLPRGIGTTFNVGISQHWIVVNKLLPEPRPHYRTYVLNRKSGRVVAALKPTEFDLPTLFELPVVLVKDQLVVPILDGFRILVPAR